MESDIDMNYNSFSDRKRMEAMVEGWYKDNPSLPVTTFNTITALDCLGVLNSLKPQGVAEEVDAPDTGAGNSTGQYCRSAGSSPASLPEKDMWRLYQKLNARGWLEWGARMIGRVMDMDSVQ